MRWKSHVRCGAGEKAEVIQPWIWTWYKPNPYLLLLVNNIKSIIDLNDISNLDKLKLINNELGKILFDETI